MTERARVVHVITMLELGGAQQNTLDTVAGLDPARYERFLVAGPGGILDARAVALPGVRTHFVPPLVREVRPSRDLRALGSLVRLFGEIRPHVVHTHSSKAGIVGRWAAALRHAPVVIHSIHGWSWSPFHGSPSRAAYVAAEWATARVTDHFIAVSEANREEGVRRGFFPRERCELIRSGFPLGPWTTARGDRAGFRAALGFPPDCPLVGMVACLKPQKAPEDFVRLAARVRAAVPEARFVLVGDGEKRGAVEQQVAREGLTGVLALAGWREDIPEVLASLDVLVLTSLWEGLPRVVPQAQAVGLPVVATRVNGTPETINDGVTGYLFEPHGVEEGASKVISLLRDPANARRIANAARGNAEAFSVETLVAAQDRLYRRLLDARGIAAGR